MRPQPKPPPPTPEPARRTPPSSPHRDDEDVELMRRFKRGDVKAFEVLLKKHKKPVYNFCLRMLGDRTGAEDAMQEVFLRVVRSAQDWEKQAKFTTWLYTIARNHCVDLLRRASYRQTASLDQTLGSEEGGQTLQDRVADEAAMPPDRGAESARLRGALDAALRALPEEQREVFVMREHAGMPFKDIAEVVGVPENTVKSRMRYALEHLRKSLEKLGVSGTWERRDG